MVILPNMPRTTCCVPGCCRRGTYLFPSDPDLKQEWLVAVQRVNWTPKDGSSICKDHFTEEDFLEEDDELTEKLKSTAVPSVFWWGSSSASLGQEKAGNGATKKGGSKSIMAAGSLTSAKAKKLAVANVPDNDGDYEDEDFEDEFQDAGAMEDSDEEYRGEEDEPEEEDEDGVADDDDPDFEIMDKSPKGGSARKRTPATRLKAGAGKGPKKRKHGDDTGDSVLKESKRARSDVPAEYPRQLNKAYKEISRLATRCQLLDAALKNKSYVTHRSRTLYQIGKYVLPHQLSFIEAQAVNATLSPGLRRWSRRMRNISLGLHRHSRHAYNFMAKLFALPTEAELQKWGAQSETSSSEGDVACNNVTLTEAEALVDEATFDNLMSVIL